MRRPRAADGPRSNVPGYAELLATARADPQSAPVALALAAVARYAGPAREQAEWLHRVYPRVAPERLAGVAVASAARRSRWAGVLVVTRFGALTNGAVDLMARARLVVEIAAIFGYEPGDAARAAEILTVLRAFTDTGSAAAAVEAVLRGERPLPTALADAPRAAAPLPLVPLGTAAAARVARKAVARWVPGSALVMAVVGGPAATTDAGRRAIRLYRASAAVDLGGATPAASDQPNDSAAPAGR